ncbi:MAG: hypothetical protein IT245_05795 [Bacteroidia bacterium]|nr:hypothetical protein [Bacteroidia bacterium]
MKNQAILLISSLVVLAYACKKEDKKDDDQTKSKPKSELIQASQWKVNSLVSGSMDVWNTPFVDACNRDNQYKFRSDDSLVLFDMTSKCNTSDPDSTVSFYKLIDNDTKIILNVNLTSTVAINDTADIIVLDENTLQLNAEYSGLPATITFKHP